LALQRFDAPSEEETRGAPHRLLPP